MAYSADKGDKLLEIATGQRGMGPPITYQLDGRQFVSFLAGQGTLPAGRGAPPPPGVAPPPGTPPPATGCPPPAGAGNAPPGGNAPLDPTVNKPRIYTFVLDGKLPLPNAAAAR
jgi:hypothetical protein